MDKILPYEILLVIFSRLTWEELHNIKNTCATFHIAAMDMISMIKKKTHKPRIYKLNIDFCDNDKYELPIYNEWRHEKIPPSMLSHKQIAARGINSKRGDIVEVTFIYDNEPVLTPFEYLTNQKPVYSYFNDGRVFVRLKNRLIQSGQWNLMRIHGPGAYNWRYKIQLPVMSIIIFNNDSVVVDGVSYAI